MSSAHLMIFVLALASATAAVISETKPSDKLTNQTVNTTISEAHTTPTAAAKSSEESDDGGTDTGNLRKRTIEQAVGFGYRYNSVLRPLTPSNPQPSPQRRQPAYQQRGIPPAGISSSPASYYFQQQIQPSPSPNPKPAHRFAALQLPTYPRTYSREPAETRPVTESQVPVQPAQDLNLYKEFFTFEDAVPPYQLAPRSEATSFLTPQALLLASAGSHHLGQTQQVIPVLILRLDSPAHFPYPMMAMQVVPREEIKVYGSPSSIDPAQVQQQFIDPAYGEVNPGLAYYTVAAQQQYAEDKSRRVHPAMQQERYRGSQTDIAESKIGLRRPSGTGSPVVSSAGTQKARTEVTIHHSPGMTAQDYKESVEEQEEA